MEHQLQFCNKILILDVILSPQYNTEEYSIMSLDEVTKHEKVTPPKKEQKI